MKRILTLQSHRPLFCAMAGVLGLGAAAPALADSELDALKRELAEQKQLIQRLVADQEAQKKTAPAAAAAPAAANGAAPASGITVYGTLDGGIERISNIQNGTTTGSLTRTPSITGTIASRLGFRAAKEVMPGVKAIATLEAGFNLDDGSLGQAGRIFGRQLYAGVDTPYGRFTLGRQYSMLIYGIGDSDLLGPNIYAMGSLDAYLPNARYDNSLAWMGKFSKVSMGATYSTGRDTKGGAPASGTCAGEEVGKAQACRGWSAMVKYDDPAYGVALAVDEQRGGTGATASFFNGAAPVAFSRPDDTDRRTVLGGYVNIGPAKIGAGWMGRKLEVAAGEIESDAYYLELAYKLSDKVSFDGGLHRISNDVQNRDASLQVVRGFYHFDKDFSTYLQLGHISNSANARYAVSVGPGISPPAGGSQTASMVGLRYRF